MAHRSLTLTIGLIMGFGCSYTVNGPPARAQPNQPIQCDEEASARRPADAAGGALTSSAGIMVLAGLWVCDGTTIYRGCIVGGSGLKVGLGAGAMAIAVTYAHALVVSGKRIRACPEAKARFGGGANAQLADSNPPDGGLD